VASKLSLFLAELKRRKVYRVATVYVVVGLGVIAAAEGIFPPLGLEQVQSLVVVLVLLGLPIALSLAWAYELKPEEPRPEEPSEEELPLSPEPETPIRVTDREQRKSIVVLPFDNMSPDPGDAYFSDGLTEEIITHLSYLRSLRVISRNSAMVLKGTEKDTRTIGEELDVQYVLEGSVRKAGNDLRITAQLIDAGRDEHLWAETYDGTMEDVFLIQEQTALSIAEALRLSITPEEEQRLAERPIENVQAYELYLVARRDFWAGTPDGLERARRNLETGLEIIGENVVLLQGLAEVYLHEYELGVKADEEILRGAEDLANRITVLQPNSAHSHYLFGRIERFRGSCIKAIDHLEQALAIDPNHSSSQLFLFHSYSLQAGRAELADPLRTEVLARNPLDFLTWFVIGLHDWMKGNVEEGSSAFRRGAGFGGGNDFADIFVAYGLIWLDRRSEALALIEDVVQRDMMDIFTEWADFLRRALKGEGASAREALSEKARRYLWNDPEVVWLAASTFALSGEKEEALDWLEHAVEGGWINYPLFAEQDPLLESIRGEERFRELMVNVKRDWEDFGAERKAHA